MRDNAYQAMTIGRGIRCAAVRAPDKPAIVLDDQWLSYAQLVDRINRAANLARDHLALTPGDRVALVAPNCIEYVELVAGLSDAGGDCRDTEPAPDAGGIAGDSR